MTPKKPTQRDFMRGLVAKFGQHKEVVCRAYVVAEANGLVTRKSKTKTPEEYADALWRDGSHKGWFDA